MNYEILVWIAIAVIVIVAIKIVWDKFKAYETLKYEFVTIIAHKFRTPLTQVKWLIETLKENEQDSYKIESLKIMAQSNQQLISLTGTLIELTESSNKSLTSYTFEKVNLCDTINQVTNSLKDHFHEKNLFLAVQCDPSDILVKIDRARMEFVLQTILENTIHYSPPGRNVEVIASINKKKAIINIVDYGIGIDTKDMPHMFTKFFRTSNAKSMDTEGFGVGLYLAQSIMKRHGGKIEAFSEGVGKGTTFRVSLPLVK